mmetsp:Transcript_78940/g.189503  ORF Transcript_78940/g.189503 Transcript_78940/m.189503 type:complete len:80 (-) Transcript_78940:138-377(-)
MSDVMDVDSLKSGSALRSQGDFWALHAKLGKCYEAEMAEWMARVEELEGDSCFAPRGVLATGPRDFPPLQGAIQGPCRT